MIRSKIVLLLELFESICLLTLLLIRFSLKTSSIELFFFGCCCFSACSFPSLLVIANVEVSFVVVLPIAAISWLTMLDEFDLIILFGFGGSESFEMILSFGESVLVRKLVPKFEKIKKKEEEVFLKFN